MMDKLLALLLGWQARRQCLEHGHRQSIAEVRYNGSGEISVSAPCTICGAMMPVAIVRGAERAAPAASPIILRAVGGRAARYAGTTGDA